jgi:hypothetical protein
MKALAFVAGLALAAIVAATTLSGTPGPPVSSSPARAAYSIDVVAGASAMTQQMAVSTDPTHAYQPHAGDEQLRLSADPAFLRQLEAYQSAVDRMLARRP